MTDMTTEGCTLCDGEGFIAGGERGEVMEPCPRCNPTVGDGVALKSTSHPGSENISSDALEQIELEIGPKEYKSLRAAYGKNALLTDRLIISDQLVRIETLLSAILSELLKPKDEEFPF